VSGRVAALVPRWARAGFALSTGPRHALEPGARYLERAPAAPMPASDPLLTGFPPIGAAACRVLVLGSFPSTASLAAGEYYAHGRNALWLAFERLGIARSLPYAQRCAALAERGIAVWDVIERCAREGSLDSAIRAPRYNDLAAFARAQPRLRAILLNGRKAEQGFLRALGDTVLPARITVLVLPSTSPANTRPGKLDAWERALREALRPRGGLRGGLRGGPRCRLGREPVPVGACSGHRGIVTVTRAPVSVHAIAPVLAVASAAAWRRE